VKYDNLNNNYYLKQKFDIYDFMDWKKEKLLNELFHNPNFILEFDKTYKYGLLDIKGVCVNHPTTPYLNKFLHDHINDQIHFFLSSIKPKIISNNYNILMPSPGNIVYDLGLDKRYNTGWLSNVLLKVKNTKTDILLQTNNISESYIFPYKYELVNMEWVSYDVTTINELGVEIISPIFSLDKIYSIENYCSYLAIHPNNADNYKINSLSDVDKLYFDLIWLGNFYKKFLNLRKLNINLSETGVINFIEELTLVLY